MNTIGYNCFMERDYQTLGKLAYNAWNRNRLDIIVYGNYWYFQDCENDRLYNYVHKRMKIEYPNLKYLA